MKKSKLFMIVTIIVFIISIGSSVAYYGWISSSNAVVSFNSCTPEIYFTGGTTINGNNLIPVLDKQDGTKKEIKVKLNKNCGTGTMNLKLDLNTLDSGLKDPTFVYEVYKDNIILSDGNFSNYNEGDTITILENQIIDDTLSTYEVYIYLNGNYDNPITTQNQEFKFSIWGEGNGAIYKENYLAPAAIPTSDQSTFLGSPIPRGNIKTLTIEDNNIVPQGVENIDISSNHDGSVMLWYTDDNEDGLYDVSIGSTNGIIYCNSDASRFFSYLTNLEYLDLSNFNTSNVIYMSNMFLEDTKLVSVNLSNFDTNSVTTMENMFKNCSSLKSLDLSNFVNTKVTTIAQMFYNCSSLTDLNLTNFETRAVTNMAWMFYNCSSLTRLDLSNFNTEKVNNMASLFRGCKSLRSIDLSSFRASLVTSMTYMFESCENLLSLDLSSFYQPDFNNPKLKDIGRMFQGCKNLLSINLENFNTDIVADMTGTFWSCASLKSLDLTSFNTSSVKNMTSMFNSCTSLETLTFGANFKTRLVTNMAAMFSNCRRLQSLDLSGFDTSNVSSMGQMFYGCASLTTLDLSNFKTTLLTEIRYLFRECANLQTIYVNQFDFTKIPSYSGAFANRMLTDAVIYVTDEAQVTWFSNNFPTMTNVTVYIPSE